MIYVAGSTQDFQRHSLRLGKLDERVHIGLGKDAAHSGAGLQATRSDFLVETQGQGEIDRVGVYAFTEGSYFVDKRDLGCNEGGGRLAHKFGGSLVGDDHRNAAHHKRVINLLQKLHSLTGGRSEDQAVGPVEVFDRTTVREEHGLGHDRSLQSNIAERFRSEEHTSEL